MKINSSFLSALMSVGGGSLVLTLGRTVTVLIATRFIEVSELGVYFILIAAAGVMTSLAGCGTNISLVKYAVEEENHRNKITLIISSILFFMVSLFVVVGFSLLINAQMRYVEMKPEYILLFLSFALFFYLNFALQGLKKFSSISIANSINGITKIALTALLIGYMGFGFTGLVWSIVISNLLGVLVQLKAITQRVILNDVLIYNHKKIKDILRFSAPIYINQLYSNLYDRGYTILIAFMLDPVAVAYYGVATMVPQFINQLRQVFNGVYFPKICEILNVNNTDKAKQLLVFSISLIFVTIAISSIMFYMFDELIIKLLFSIDYLTVSLAIFILLSRSALAFCSAIMGFTLVALGKNSVPLKINIFITTVSFALSYFTIPEYGYMAVVYVAFISSIMGFSLNAICLHYSGFPLVLNSSMWLSIAVFVMLVIAIATNAATLTPYLIVAFMLLAIYSLYKSNVYKALRGSFNYV